MNNLNSARNKFSIERLYLNSDTTVDFAIAYKDACGGTGNCFWSLYTTNKNSTASLTYVGMIPASAFELSEVTDQGFKRIKGIWKNSGANNGSCSVYAFKQGKYKQIKSGTYSAKDSSNCDSLDE